MTSVSRSVRRLTKHDWLEIGRLHRHRASQRNPTQLVSAIGRVMASALSQMLGSVVAISPPNEENALQDVDDISALRGMIGAKYEWEGVCATTYFCIDRASLCVLIDAVLGASVDGSADSVERPFGRIDRRIAHLIFDRLSEVIVDASAGGAAGKVKATRNVVDIESVFESPSLTGPKVCVLEVTCGALACWISVVASANDWGELLRVGSSPDEARRVNADKWRRALSQQIDQTEVHLSAIIEERGVALSEIEGLRKGAILKLTAAPQASVVLAVDKYPVAVCRMGLERDHIAMRVLETVM